MALGIVPLCRTGRAARGLALAAAFGAGLTFTLTIWGVAVASAGGFLGLGEASRYLSLAGGVVAYVLGLGMLALVRVPLPSLNVHLPVSLRTRSGVLGAFVLGLLLGNIGMCCPDPVFLSLLPFIAASRDAAGGALLAAAYGAGRATPLVVLVLLARSGIDALRLATDHKHRVDRSLGWGLVAIGTLMLYGYSNVAHPGPMAVLLMTAPALAYHRMRGSPWPHTTGWLVATAVATLVGLQTVHLVLVNLP